MQSWKLHSWKWLILIILIKGGLFCFFAWELQQLEGDRLIAGVFRVYDDTKSYYDPIENLVDGQGYSRFGYAELEEEEIVAFAGRMPGLLPIYGPLYALFGAETGKALMVFLQFLIGCLSVWVFGQLAFYALKSRRMALMAMLGLLIYYPLHIYEHAGASETLSIGFVLFSFWYWIRFEESEKEKWLLIAGIFFAWAVFLRPILGSFGLGFLSLGLRLSLRGRSRQAFFKGSFWKNTIVFFLPLLLALCAWTARNAISMNRFIVLEDAWHLSYPHEPEYGEGGMAIRKMIRSWGGDMLYWTEGSMGKELMNPQAEAGSEIHLPKRIYTPDYQQDSIQKLRNIYLEGKQAQAREMAERFLTSYRQHYPYEAYFFHTIRLTGKFFFRLIRHDLPFPPKEQLKGYQLLIKGFYILYYYFWAILGLAGGIFALFQKNKQLKTGLIFPLGMTLVLTAILGMIEERYLLPLFPFMLIYGLVLLSKLPFMRNLIQPDDKSQP